MNIARLQIKCTDSVHILSTEYENMVFYVSVSFILVLGKNFGRFCEMGSSKSKSLNGLIMVIFKYLVLFYAHYPVFLFFYSNDVEKFYKLRKYNKKFDSTTMDLTQL